MDMIDQRFCVYVQWAPMCVVLTGESLKCNLTRDWKSMFSSLVLNFQDWFTSFLMWFYTMINKAEDIFTDYLCKSIFVNPDSIHIFKSVRLARNWTLNSDQSNSSPLIYVLATTQVVPPLHCTLWKEQWKRDTFLSWSYPHGNSADRSTSGSLCPVDLGLLSWPCFFINASNIMSEQTVQQSSSEYLRQCLSLFFLRLPPSPPYPPHFSLSAEEHD